MSEHWTGLGDLMLSACGFLAERTLVFGGPGKDASAASPVTQGPAPPLRSCHKPPLPSRPSSLQPRLLPSSSNLQIDNRPPVKDSDQGLRDTPSSLTSGKRIKPLFYHLAGCMTLGESVPFSEPQCPHFCHRTSSIVLVQL